MKTLFKDMIFISLIFLTNSLTLNSIPKLQTYIPNILIQKPDFEPVNCLYGFKPESVTGISTPIRLNRNYEVECLSLNGKDCINEKVQSSEDCYKFTLQNELTLKPLVCGQMHKSIYGKEGYGDAEHWCEKGRQWFFNRWHCSDETGLPTSIRLDWKTKNVECLSSNGKDCVLNDVKACQRANTSRRKCKFTKPVRCGLENIKLFNNINPYYDPKQNWCKLGNEYLFGETQWICGGDSFGIDVPFRYNDYGDIECFSINGKDCAWETGTGRKCTEFIKSNMRNVNPVACGEMHKAIKGVDGYSTKSHWCRTLMDKFVLTTRDN
jgi:hypothetical protein